jgi:signal transduction histidine kinase
MRLMSKQPFRSFGVVVALGTLFVVLALLQYKWTTQASDAERQRLQATLQTAMNQFREDLHRELASICSAFEINPVGTAEEVENLYAQHYEYWERTAAHRELVANVYVWKQTGKQTTLLFHLNPMTGRFEQVDCPSRFGDLCGDAGLSHSPVPGRVGPMPLPFAWSLRGQIPALAHFFFQTAPRGKGQPHAISRLAGWTIIELNRDFLVKELFPELAQHHFGSPKGLAYQVAVLRGEDARETLYLSAPVPPEEVRRSADGTLRLFGPRHPHPSWPRTERIRSDDTRMSPDNAALPSYFLPRDGDLAERFRSLSSLVIVPDAAAGSWQLVVRHHSGSLRDAVAGMRRKNLALGFGVLLVLAASMAMIIIWTQRIQSLAKLQMDFVAGVSHELLTPLSVIRSAAENLADGVVGAKPLVREYGVVIRNEGLQLSAMVKQILLFAAARERGHLSDFRRVQIGEAIECAAAGLAALIEANKFTVEKQIEPNLPPVLADPAALTQCLQNLITNALKYGAANRWMAIRAHAVAGTRAPEIQITVQDRGPGIEPKEASQIFEPFFRGRAARASQIHGTGLGLTLAKEAAEAMGGRLSVTSKQGEGSAFTLHFPAAEQMELQPVETA